MSKPIEKQYTNEEITIVWKPDICVHSGICAKGLAEVFNPRARPWVNMEGATTDRIVQQVRECPSGALSYFVNEVAAEAKEEANTDEQEVVNVEVIPNGPLMVHCTVKVKDAAGKEEIRKSKSAFCRCGASTNKPYCDGSHRSINFEG